MELLDDYRKKMYSPSRLKEAAIIKEGLKYQEEAYAKEAPKVEEAIITQGPIKVEEPILVPKKAGRSKRKWVATESSVSFNFNNLVKKVKDHLKEQYPDASAEEITLMTGKNLEVFMINDQLFKYTSTPNKLGGVRWYVICPKCKKRSLKLYLPKIAGRDPLYLCKMCHKLKPSSLLFGNRKRYKDVTRPLKKLEQVKRMLLKKKLKPKEVEDLLAEYARIEKKLADSPEYRLWKFKKEHGRSH